MKMLARIAVFLLGTTLAAWFGWLFFGKKERTIR
jgi:hypothetical protein